MDSDANNIGITDGMMGGTQTQSPMANPQDVESPIDETTSLVSGVPITDSEANEIIEQNLWAELSQPWPSTYERSISLLASPMISPKQIEFFTQSPKPGASYLGLAQRREVRSISTRFEFLSYLTLIYLRSLPLRVGSK
jgi:hypothetical protein